MTMKPCFEDWFRAVVPCKEGTMSHAECPHLCGGGTWLTCASGRKWGHCTEYLATGSLPPLEELVSEDTALSPEGIEHEYQRSGDGPLKVMRRMAEEISRSRKVMKRIRGLALTVADAASAGE